jgi:hypothetical protein
VAGPVQIETEYTWNGISEALSLSVRVYTVQSLNSKKRFKMRRTSPAHTTAGK